MEFFSEIIRIFGIVYRINMLAAAHRKKDLTKYRKSPTRHIINIIGTIYCTEKGRDEIKKSVH
jgi:hypothetical protein